MSVQEAADALGMTPQGVRARLHRGTLGGRNVEYETQAGTIETRYEVAVEAVEEELAQKQAGTPATRVDVSNEIAQHDAEVRELYERVIEAILANRRVNEGVLNAVTRQGEEVRRAIAEQHHEVVGKINAATQALADEAEREQAHQEKVRAYEAYIRRFLSRALVVLAILAVLSAAGLTLQILRVTGVLP